MTEKKKKFTIEELYQNKNFVPPKEKNLETIFEEPRKAKDGAPILTSVRKYKRYLHFDPTEGKIHKRKLKAKKCIGHLKNGKNSRTRSSTKKPKCKDISMYIMEAIGESSDSEMEATYDKGTNANNKGSDRNNEGTSANDEGTDANDKSTIANDKGTDGNNKSTNANNEGTDANSNGTDANDKGTNVNDKGSAGNLKYTSSLGENVVNASTQSKEKEENVLNEDIEMISTQDLNTTEKDKPERKDVEKTKSPSRSSCIVT